VIPGLQARLEAIGAAEPALVGALEGLLGARLRCEVTETLRSGAVERLAFAGAAGARTLVIKRLSLDRAHREARALRHWLPRAGLDDFAVPLLAVAPAADGAAVWHVYEDLGGRTLEHALASEEAGCAAVAASARAASELHVGFSGHALLAEVRLAGLDLGPQFFANAIADARRALRALRGRGGLDARGRDATGRLAERLARLAEEAPARSDAFRTLAWPETLLHGDLWPSNVAVLARDRVRLLDWERTGIGPAVYDLSTLLRRLPPAARPVALAEARVVTSRAGWLWPGPELLERVSETCELARFASCLGWRVLAALDAPREAGVPTWLVDDLVEIEGWFQQRPPLLDAARSAA